LLKKKWLPESGETRETGTWREKIQFLCDSMEATSQPFVAGYPDGRMFTCNDAFCKLTGYAREELLRSLTWSIDLTPPEWREREAGALAMLHGTGETQRYEKEYVRKDGARIPVELIVNDVIDVEGNLLVYIAFVNNTGDRKRAENELQWANRALKALSKCKEAMIRAEDEPTLLNDICHIIVNEGGYRLAWIGYIEDDDARTVRPVARAGYDEGYVDNLKIALNDPVRGSGPTGISLKTGKPYGSRNVHSDAAMQPWRQEALKRGYLSTLNLPVIYEGQTLGTLVIYSGRPGAFEDEELGLLVGLAENLAYGVKAIRDRERRDKAEKELQRAKDELEIRVRERTEELRQAKVQAELYVDLLSHDINNLNHIAMTHLEIAREMLELKNEDKALIERPIESLLRSTVLIDNVRKLQRIAEGDMTGETIELGGLLSEVAAAYRIPGAAVEMRRDINDPCYVMANQLLHDVFSNLLSNAIKHSKADSPEIFIRFETVTEEGKKMFKVSVEDNGPGVPDDMKEKIFNRLQRGETKARGMGLGLYLAKSLVDSYHGRVWVEDHLPGDHTKGSRFVVILPAL
jgi:PAS domain S-box-containing protein